MKKYMTGGTEKAIAEVEIIRETVCTVTFPNGRVEHKSSRDYTYHDTWEIAHNHLLQEALSLAAEIERRLVGIDKRIETIRAMVKPEG